MSSHKEPSPVYGKFKVTGRDSDLSTGLVIKLSLYLVRLTSWLVTCFFRRILSLIITLLYIKLRSLGPMV